MNSVPEIARDPRVYAGAAKLIEEGGLAKEWFALDADEKTVNITAPEAISFCVMGAVCRAAYDLKLIDDRVEIERFGFDLLSSVRQALGLQRSPNTWSNDRDTTKEDVVAALKGADVSRLSPA